MSKHTPGPWDYGQTPPLAGVTITKGFWFGSKNRLDIGEVYVTAGQDVSVQEANARLIAAAPELLDALELALRHMTDSTMECSCSTRGARVSVASAIRSTIAKAKGEFIE